ncbi:MAG: hypothetical protein ACM33T_10310 [Solirubrobacterales bacterium]
MIRKGLVLSFVFLAATGCASPDVLDAPPPQAHMPTLAATPLPAVAQATGGAVSRDIGAAGLPATEKTGTARPAGPAARSGGWDTVLAAPGLPARRQVTRTDDGWTSADGVSANQLGDLTFFSDGSWMRRVGDAYKHSDGKVTVKRGDTFFHADGSWSRQVGDTVTRSDGRSCSIFGNAMTCR